MIEKGYNRNMISQAISEHYTIRGTFKIKEYLEEAGPCGTNEGGEKW